MKNERLTGLTLGYIYKKEDIDISEVINIFAKSKPRRMELLDWSKDEA